MVKQIYQVTISALFYILTACTGLQPVEDVIPASQPPEIHPQAVQLFDAFQGRLLHVEDPVQIVYQVENQSSFEDSIADLAARLFLSYSENPSLVFERATDSIDRGLLLRRKVFFVLTLTLKEDNGDHIFTSELQDLRTENTETRNDRILFRDSEENRLRFHRAHGFVAIPALSETLPDFPATVQRDLPTFFERMGTGNLEILSSMRGTPVQIFSGDRHILSRETPQHRVVLKEGRYTVRALRRGQEPLVREIEVRAGESRSLFFSWPDDYDGGNLIVSSLPAAARFAVDGVVRGETPGFIPGLEEGTYNIEISRRIAGQNFRVLSQFDVTVPSGETITRYYIENMKEFWPGGIADPDFWSLTSERGEVQLREGRVVNHRNASGLRGVFSEPIVADNFHSEFFIHKRQRSVVGIYGKREIAIVEFRGNRLGFHHFSSSNEQMISSSWYELPDNGHPDYWRLNLHYRNSGRISVSMDGHRIFHGDFMAGNTMRFAFLSDIEKIPVASWNMQTGSARRMWLWRSIQDMQYAITRLRGLNPSAVSDVEAVEEVEQ